MDLEVSNSNVSFSAKSLFGGGMVCLIPKNSIDASTMIKVPDHQEVFRHQTADQSIIIDILEYQEHVQREEAPRYHFIDIADANDAKEENQVQLIEGIDSHELSMTQCQEAWHLSGIQKVSKFKEKNGAKNVIEIHLGLFRLPNFGSDIVVTMNNPIIVSDNSSSSHPSQFNQEDIWTSDVFKNVLHSLKIVDTSLFT